MLNFQMNIVKRIKNPVWWFSLVGAIAIIVSYFGVDITKYIGQDWKGLIGAIFSLLTVLGITADTSTKGLSDVVQAPNEQSTSNNISPNITLYGDTLSDSVKKILQDNNLISENKVNFSNTGMTATGDLKVVNQDGTSQIEIKKDSVNSSVQDNNTQSRSYDAILQENADLKEKLQNNLQA